jgi:hypothetical protein
MANLFEQKDRRVIPNWRSFYSTWRLNELYYSKKNIVRQIERRLSINDYITAWDNNKSTSFAGDLISAAFVNGFVNIKEVKEAANSILNNKVSTFSLNELARLILKTETEDTKTYEHSNILNEFIPSNYYIEIKKTKERINNYPNNPIPYVDLSRLYTILGIENKSIKHMKIALGLAPDNRFILRAAARLFSHFDQHDFIHELIKKSELVKIDPWITSTEIALATILNKRSRYIKIGTHMIGSGNFDWHSLTELASSIGTLEFLNGNRRKAKKFLITALKSPNDNTLAQIEWINNLDVLLNINPYDYKIYNKYEALALDDYFNKKYDSAFDQCKEWFSDLPFSKQAVIFGSHIANSLLDKTNDAVKFLKIGLHSHPRDPQIINNLAYSLALQNRIEDAEKYLNQLIRVSDINTNTRICLTATKGLIAFRKGEVAAGNDLYQKAIVSAKSTRNDYLIWLANLNYAREIVLSHSKEMGSIQNIISLVPDNHRFPDLIKLKAEVISLFIRERENS